MSDRYDDLFYVRAGPEAGSVAGMVTTQAPRDHRAAAEAGAEKYSPALGGPGAVFATEGMGGDRRWWKLGAAGVEEAPAPAPVPPTRARQLADASVARHYGRASRAADRTDRRPTRRNRAAEGAATRRFERAVAWYERIVDEEIRRRNEGADQ